MIKKSLLLALTIISLSYAYCQTSDSTGDDNKNHLKLGVQYISNQTYAGRTDSIKLPVITPYVNFETHFGLYVKATGYINLSAGSTSFDGAGIETGYEFSKKNWNGSISFVKNFISDSSNLIIAPVKASFEFYLENDNKIITPSIGAEYLFTNEGNDFIFYGGLSKSITVVKDHGDPLVALQPAVNINGGTQNFYYSFLKHYAKNGYSKSKGRGRSTILVPITQTIEQQSQRFALLSTSFELPIDFTKGKFEWKTTPAFEAPFNLVASGSEGTQQAKPYFYISTEFVYTF
jgi:hypothetical protein